MSSRTLDLFCVLGQQRAVRGLTDPQPPTLRLYENNTYALRLNALRALSGGFSPFAAAKFSEFATFEAAIGVLDASPTSGKWKIKVTGETQTTSALDFNVSAANLATALNALTAVTSAGGVTVSLWNSLANVFIVRPVVAEADITFVEAANQLVPSCAIRIRKAADGGGNYTMVKLHQGYLSFADEFEFPNPPPPTISTQVAGDASRNCIQVLLFPDGAVGQFSLQHADLSTTPLAVKDLKTSTVAAALNGLFSDGATNARFACFDFGDTGVQIECIGPLARTNVPTFGLTLYGQAPLDTPAADFQITPLPIELRVSGKDTTDVLFELAGFDARGNEHTLVRMTATIVNTLLTLADSQLFASSRTKYETVYQTADAEADAAIIGQRSAKIVAAGSGTSPTAGAYVLVFTHNLATTQPLVSCWMLTDPSGSGSWRQMDETEFDASSHGNPNAVTISFATTPPTAGHVGAVQIFATNLDAEVAIKNHTHTTEQILGIGEDAGRTLTQIIALLRAGVSALTGDLPSIPGSLLADGSVDAGKLNLASLIAALMTPAGAGFTSFMTALRTDVQDATLITNFLTALSSSSQLATTLTSFAQTLLTKLNGTAEFAAAMQATIAASPSLNQFFADMILSALQDGAVLKDAVLFTVPDLVLALPMPDTANGDLANGETDGFFPLPLAVFTTLTDDGNITGILPEPSSSLKGHYRTVVGEAYSYYRDFTDGQIVYCTGLEWFPGVIVSGKMFTTDGDVQLFSIEVNDKMLAVGTRFSVLAGLQLSLAGNCAGRWLLELKRGTVDAEASGSPGNISTITWDDTILSEQLIFDATAITHNFGFAVSRTAESTFAATKTLYTTTSSATAPTSGKFVLAAFLSRLDTQNVTEPRGRITARMLGVKASIVTLPD